MRRFAQSVLVCSAAAVIGVIAVVLFNTWRLSPPADAVAETTTAERRAGEIDRARVARRLADAIAYPTVSMEPDGTAFAGFREWLRAAYPRFHEATELEILGGGSLLYTWTGRSGDGDAVLLAGHYDVVPVDPATLDAWSYAPFAGTVADSFIWGRGALDNKGAVVAMVEAAEALIATGFRPERTIYFSFGHDEEVGGADGAAVVVEHLAGNGPRIAWSLDEGSYLLDGGSFGVARPVASINVAEKGYVTLAITARSAGGHSSVPPRETAVVTLARAIIAIQDHPIPGGLSGVAERMFAGLAPHLGFTSRLLFANRWLFGSVLESSLSRSPSTDALLRTTSAPTMLSGSVKENVLPTEAVAAINFRIHPRDSAEDVLGHVRDAVSGIDVDVEILNGRVTPPSKMSSHRSAGYELIARSLRQTYGDIVVLPGLTMAATDSKHYGRLAENSYRINPFVLGPGDGARIHGVDERISVDNLVMGIVAYMQLIEQL